MSLDCLVLMLCSPVEQYCQNSWESIALITNLTKLYKEREEGGKDLPHQHWKLDNSQQYEGYNNEWDKEISLFPQVESSSSTTTNIPWFRAPVWQIWKLKSIWELIDTVLKPLILAECVHRQRSWKYHFYLCWLSAQLLSHFLIFLISN